MLESSDTYRNQDCEAVIYTGEIQMKQPDMRLCLETARFLW